jgi:hypothetical protein
MLTNNAANEAVVFLTRDLIKSTVLMSTKGHLLEYQVITLEGREFTVTINQVIYPRQGLLQEINEDKVTSFVVHSEGHVEFNT